MKVETTNNHQDGVAVQSFYEFSGITQSHLKEDINTLIQIKTDKVSQEKLDARAAIHIAVVLDISGSMSGSRLKWAIRGIRKLIKHLVPNKDKLHVILYGSVAKLYIEDADLSKKDDLDAKVKQIRTEGCTNLCIGLDLARNTMLKHRKDDELKGKSVVERMFVFSDGQVNEGIQSLNGIGEYVQGIVKNDIILSSFGIGEGFNENLMRMIAVEGKGDFYYIENPEQATAILSKAIHGMLELTATDVSLELTPMKGFSLKEICYQSATKGSNKIVIGDLHPENTLNIAQIWTYDSKMKPSNNIAIFSYELKFSTPSGEKRSIKGICNVDVVEGVVTENIDAKVALLAWNTAIRNKTVTALIESNKRDEALSMKKEIISDLEKYKSKDLSGVVDRMYQMNQNVLNDIENRSVRMDVLQKRAFKNAYTEECNNEWMYDEGCDSDSWSDDDEPNNPPNIAFSNSNVCPPNDFYSDESDDDFID